MTDHPLLNQIALATYNDESNTVRLVFYQKASDDPFAPVTHHVAVTLSGAEQFVPEEAPSDPAAPLPEVPAEVAQLQAGLPSATELPVGASVAYTLPDDATAEG